MSMKSRPQRVSQAPTIREVAALAKVSTATVSHVLNDTGRAGAYAKDRVMAAIAELGYRPNGNAASLRSRRSRIVGLVVPSITNTFFAQMASEFESLAMDSGYDIAIVTSNEDPEREHERIQALMSRQIEGLIVYPSSDHGVGNGLSPFTLPPTVLMDRGLNLAGFDTVGLNNERAGHNVARHLLDQGHRRFTVLLPSLELAASRDRAVGIENALRRSDEKTHVRVIVGGHAIEGARGAIEQDLHRDDRPTAIIATTNVATLGAIKAIQALQLTMPHDVSLVGFDDFEWMTALRPYVTAMGQPTRELAASAWRLLLERMGSNIDRDRDVQHLILDGTFTIRESSGRVRQTAGV
jgi:LacI family transcriptional regulator